MDTDAFTDRCAAVIRSTQLLLVLQLLDNSLFHFSKIARPTRSNIPEFGMFRLSQVADKHFSFFFQLPLAEVMFMAHEISCKPVIKHFYSSPFLTNTTLVKKYASVPSGSGSPCKSRSLIIALVVDGHS